MCYKPKYSNALTFMSNINIQILCRNQSLSLSLYFFVYKNVIASIKLEDYNEKE